MRFDKARFDYLMEFWKGDTYKLDLAMKSKIRELSNKLDYMDGVDVSTQYKEERDRLRHAYQKDLADLMILFMMFFEQSNESYDDLIDLRISKFISNLPKEK